MRISDWSSDVCSSDLFGACLGEFIIAQNLACNGFALHAIHDETTAHAVCGTQNKTDRRHRHTDLAGKPDQFSFRFQSSRRGSFPTFSAGRSEEHTSELQSLMRISYAVFCLKKKIKSINIIYKK